jgi:endonuclease/exonuclease/phosphatase family metal-dependent hydrolase
MALKVASWNIWVNNHFNLVKDFLYKSDADIIGLQEVSENDQSRDTVKYLNSLGYKHVFAPQLRPWDANGRKDGPALFTKFEIVESKKYVLSEEYGVGAVQANLRIGGKVVRFFSAHLSHTHQKDSAIQMQQVERLLNLIPSDLSVLMGDFNATPDSQTIQKVKEVLIDVDQKDLPTWSVYPEGCEVCLPQTIETDLDYIFTTKDIVSRSFKVEESSGSDHLPISVILEL